MMFSRWKWYRQYAVTLCAVVTAAFTNASSVWSAQEEPDQVPDIEQQLLSHYKDWAGTRHRMGGDSKAGIDCSSFIRQLFLRHFGVQLPRTSREQRNEGQPVTVGELRSGDLLFFKSGPTLSHVGVYLHGDRFLHVSSSAGVMLSKLTDTYWRTKFNGARRLSLFTAPMGDETLPSIIAKPANPETLPSLETPTFMVAHLSPQ